MPEQIAMRRGECLSDITGDRPTMLRILVVEDDRDLLSMTLAMLRRLGHWATGVSSAELALNRFFPGGFDVLLTDVHLPGLSGLDLAEKLTAYGVPVIFASGLPRPSRYAPAFGQLLAKPYTLEELRQGLEDATMAFLAEDANRPYTYPNG